MNAPLRPSRPLLALLLAAALTLALTGCVTDPRQQAVSAAQVYCETQGYRFETRLDVEGNPINVCVFWDNFECEALEFLYGRCFPERTTCALTGNRLEAAQNVEGTVEYALCRFADNSACLAFDYALFADKCTRVRQVTSCVQIPGGMCLPR